MAAAIKSAETAMRIGDPNSARLNGERLAEVPVDAVPISLAVRSRYVGILGRIEPFFAFQFAIELGVRRTDASDRDSDVELARGWVSSHRDRAPPRPR